MDKTKRKIRFFISKRPVLNERSDRVPAKFYKNQEQITRATLHEIIIIRFQRLTEKIRVLNRQISSSALSF